MGWDGVLVPFQNHFHVIPGVGSLSSLLISHFELYFFKHFLWTDLPPIAIPARSLRLRFAFKDLVTVVQGAS